MADSSNTAANLTFAQLKELIALGKGDAITPMQIADIAAAAAMKAKMPENKQHPGKGPFSHPEGDLAHPKDTLKCQMYLGGAPLEPITLEPREVESLNRMTPGLYKVERTDGSSVILEVHGRYNSNQQLDVMMVGFPPEDPGRNNYGKRLYDLTDQFTEANRMQRQPVGV